MSEKKTPGWLSDAVFYEIYPQSFMDSNGDGIGDLPGIIQKLDYVKSLGCNAIWMNPCFDSPFRDGGYDVRDYKKVAPRYGTNEDLKRCIEEAHKRGLRLLLDLVPGHTSDQHEWFRESQKAEANPYSSRYIWTDSVWNKPSDFGSMCGVSDRSGCYVVNFFSTQPALNYGFSKVTASWQKHFTHPDCIETREALKDIMRFWLDQGCDGFRVDMADSLVKHDDDKTATTEIWKNIRQMMDEDYPDAALISEWWDPKRAVAKAGFHSDFYLDHHDNGAHFLFRNIRENGEQKSFFSKQGRGDIQEFLDDYLPQYQQSRDSGYISFFTCNHDTPRMTKSFDERECRIAYAFLFTMPGVPFLYYGDEIGMQYFDLPSVEGGYQRTGSRMPMQWAKGKNLGFSQAEPESLYIPVDSRDCAPTVEEQEDDPDSMLNFVRRLIALRHQYEDLQADASFEVIYAEKEKYPFVYRRGKMILAVNPSWKDQVIPLEETGEEIFSVGSCEITSGHLRIGGQSFGIFLVK